eukprot:2038630-Prymnesium_polylepis.2
MRPQTSCERCCGACESMLKFSSAKETRMRHFGSTIRSIRFEISSSGESTIVRRGVTTTRYTSRCPLSADWFDFTGRVQRVNVLRSDTNTPQSVCPPIWRKALTA